MSVGEWLGQAEPGESMTYHTGFLAADRVSDPQLDADAKELLELAEQGFIELTQVRLQEGVCAYLATRTGEIMG